jgi:hypothetical protein
MTQSNKPISLTPSGYRVLTGAATAIVASFLISGFTLVWKMDKLTENLSYKFDSITSQVKLQDSKLEEIDRRIRVLELEVALASRGKR